MSKVETQVDDAKKLALRCKTLEVQLRQSVSKKEHHEITSKLEKQIDSLERDLDRARAENQKTIAINKQIAGVEGLIESLIKTANAQSKTLDFIEEEASTRGKVQTVQGKVLDKLAAGTVPSNVYLQALSKIRDLEEDKRGMVRRFDYNSLETRFQELSRQMGTMVPASDYASLKERFDEATKQMADMVPASDYAASEAEGGGARGRDIHDGAAGAVRLQRDEGKGARGEARGARPTVGLRRACLQGRLPRRGGDGRGNPAGGGEGRAPAEPVPQTSAEPKVEVFEAASEPVPQARAEAQPEPSKSTHQSRSTRPNRSRKNPRPDCARPSEVVAPEAPAQVVETVPETQPEVIIAAAPVQAVTEAVETTVVSEQSIPEAARSPSSR